MKRLTYLLLISVLLLGLCACGSASGLSLQSQGSAPASAPAQDTPDGEPAAEPEAVPTDAPTQDSPAGEPQPEPTAEPPVEPAPVVVDWQGIYTAFLTDNYAQLSELCYGGIAGVGFIDLDLDGVAELVLFDSGASASMGVQFFDIVDGEVECVSANVGDLGAAFGGGHYTDVFVNANLFEDFRLMYDGDGKPFFTVNSWNGALDFLYTETIVFKQGEQSQTGAVLALDSILFRYDEFDIDTGEATSSRFESGGKAITEEEYNAAMGQMDDLWTDSGLEAMGAFLWQNQTYTEDFDGLMAMTAAAIEVYQSAVDFER